MASNSVWSNIDYDFDDTDDDSVDRVYDFVECVPIELKCRECKDALSDPHLTACCGRHFCQKCLQSLIKKQWPWSKTCPHCREKDFVHILDKPVQREINQLKVRCSYYCEWEGELGDLQTHLDSEQGFGYVEVACPNGYFVDHLDSPNGCDKEHDFESVISSNPGTQDNFVDTGNNFTIPEKLKCSICISVLSDPRLTECCGQHFCQECLQSWLNYGNKTCPHCQKEDFVHILDKPIQGKIRRLKVRCSNHTLGCEWVGTTSGLQTHLQDSEQGCDYAEVIMCPNGCVKAEYEHTSLLLRKDHLLTECLHRIYRCEYCGAEGTYEKITGDWGVLSTPGESHYDTCPNFPLDCPNGCSETKFKREYLPDHQEQCPLEPVECPNKCTSDWDSEYEEVCKYKAITKVCRKDLEEHLRKECDQRRYECTYCGEEEDTYQNITKNHYATCPNLPLGCPNECEITDIKRRDIPTHREQCPLEPVQCPFQEAGCETRPVRKDLEEHMTSQSQQHLLFRRTQLLEQECSRLKKRNDELEQKYHTLETRNGDLEERCMKLEEKNSEQEKGLTATGGRRRLWGRDPHQSVCTYTTWTSNSQ